MTQCERDIVNFANGSATRCTRRASFIVWRIGQEEKSMRVCRVHRNQYVGMFVKTQCKSIGDTP